MTSPQPNILLLYHSLGQKNLCDPLAEWKLAKMHKKSYLQGPATNEAIGSLNTSDPNHSYSHSQYNQCTKARLHVFFYTQYLSCF